VSPPEELLSGALWCDIANRWSLDADFARRLVIAADQFTAETGRGVEIISGFRTRAEQDALRQSGRPAASEETSTHRTCPATGADIRLGFLPNVTLKQIWGRDLLFQGLRFGGGSPVDDDNLPTDWQHADAGPR